jgi:hypothetical protein
VLSASRRTLQDRWSSGIRFISRVGGRCGPPGGVSVAAGHEEEEEPVVNDAELASLCETTIGNAVEHFSNPVFDERSVQRMRSAGWSAAFRLVSGNAPLDGERFTRDVVPGVRMAVLDSARAALDEYLRTAHARVAGARSALVAADGSIDLRTPLLRTATRARIATGNAWSDS